MPPVAIKSKLATSIFSMKVSVKVTRSLTLVPFDFQRVSLVEYAAKYEVSISYGSKVMTKTVQGECFLSQSLTGQKVDVPKLHSGGIKHRKNWVHGQTQREHIVPSYVSFED